MPQIISATDLQISLDGASEDGAVQVVGRLRHLVRHAGGCKLGATVRVSAKGSGRLSGLALDDQGGVWTTLRDGWSLVRFSEDGGLDRTIGLPVPSPTDLAFTGPNKDMLYITSSRHDLTMETLGNAPASGRLFRIRPELTGLVARCTDWRG